MQPVRLLLPLQRQQLLQPHLTKLAAAAFSSISPIHNSALGSIHYSFNPPKSKIFPANSAPSNKFSPVLLHPQSQEIFTQSAFLSRHGLGLDSDYGTDSQMSNVVMGVRLANENGFLSWCRNTYLATAVGVGMSAKGSAAFSSLSHETVFLVAGLNLTLGTSIFIFNNVKLRHLMGLSPLGAAGFSVGAFVHLFFWIFGLLSYTGYIVGDTSTEAQKPKITK